MKQSKPSKSTNEPASRSCCPLILQNVSLWLNILYRHLKCSLVYLLCRSIHYSEVSTTKIFFARHGVLLKKIVYSCRLVTSLISMKFVKDWNLLGISSFQFWERYLMLWDGFRVFTGYLILSIAVIYDFIALIFLSLHNPFLQLWKSISERHHGLFLFLVRHWSVSLYATVL